ADRVRRPHSCPNRAVRIWPAEGSRGEREKVPSTEHSPRSSWLLKDMVSPNPIIAPDLLEAKLSQALVDGPEILDDVQGPVLISVSLEAGEQVCPWFHGPAEIIHGAHRVKQVLENVHGRHEIEGLTWKALCLEVNILPLQLSQIQTPFAE